MGTYRFLLACLFLVAIATAQQTTSDTFKIEGVVVNSVTGKPVARALVQLNSDSAVLTGPEGVFSFDHVQGGSAHVTASKPGFFPPGSNMRVGPTVSEATAGPDSGKVVLKLAPEAVIHGHVTGRDQEPLEGIQVQILTQVFIDGRRQIVNNGNTQTDEDGNYRVANMPAGRYFVQVNALNASRRILGGRIAKTEEAYQPLYYPGTPDFDSAMAAELSAGQHLEASFSMIPVPALRVAGAVIASAEFRQVNPPVIVDANGQALYLTDRWDASSRTFEFHLPSGSFTARIVGRDQQDHPVFSEQTIAVSRSVTGLRLVLRPGVDIPVIIQTQFSKPRQSCSVSFTQPNGEVQQTDCSDMPAAHVELIGLEGTHGHFSTDYGPQQQNPANYGIRNVSPGKYMVRVRPSFSGYIQSARCGNVDVMREPLVIPAEASIGPIQVVVRDDAATLKVALRAEKPLEQGLVLLVPESGLFPETRVVGQGRGLEFQYGALAPGVYKVFAFDAASGIDYNNPEVLAKYASSAASVRVEPNDNASVAVDVIRTGD